MKENTNMSKVTQKLRSNVKVKAFRPVQRGLEKSSTMKEPYRKGVKICLERARLLTESYRETEGQSMVLRRAKALAHILDNMTIYIQDDERVVGNYSSSPNALTTHPEFYWRWLEKAVMPGEAFSSLLDDDGRKELQELNRYWKDKSVQGMERDAVPKRVQEHWRFVGPIVWGHFAESGVPDFEKVFRIGLNGIIAEAKSRMAKIEEDSGLPSEDFIRQKRFLDAVVISLEAAVRWGKRYAHLAREMAPAEENPARRGELEEIGRVCEWVPGNPPRTLHEALQSFWFIHLIHHLIELYQNGCAVRLDQVLYPIYKKQKEEGKISRAEAQQLLEFLWIKMEELGVLLMPLVGSGVAGNTMWQTITVGGVTPEGEDATNEMSYIILDACKEMRTIQPSIALRYHDKMDQEFLLSAIDLVKTGVGYPAFFNDHVVIPMLLSRGMPWTKARDYGIEACMRWTIPGEAMAYRSIAGVFVLPKCLELALNGGIDKRTGKLIGERTKDPLQFGSVDDILGAFFAQVRFFTEKLVKFHNTTDLLYREFLPRPFLSGLMRGCIENGRDCREYSFHHKSFIGHVGGINVANSLAAIQKLVFEERRVSLQELLAALRENWSGKENLRQLCVRAPKFGNDEDYVDQFVKKIYYGISAIAVEHKNVFGFPFDFDGTSSSMYYGYSGLTWATPDGRKDGDNFADGTLSPIPGTDTFGPTAVLKSASKIDPLLSPHHLLNQKFLPQHLSGGNRDKFCSYLKTWADLGIYHIQFNVVDRETLLDAQTHPEKHTDLIVRVAGYSAYFADLDKGLQDDIIRRTEQCV
ncbi:MAG: hypothetical protein C4576_28625 [Desulfobacteraceae bacterium]|nr:MAG: hypothetical protein C4576_28625 [Desulfobacteraceae bacterium]